MWSSNLKNEAMTRFGLQRHRKKKFTKLSCGQTWAPLLKIMVNNEQKMKVKGRFCSKMKQIYLQQPVKYFEIDAPNVSIISQVKTLRSTFEDHKPVVGKSFCNN